MGEERLQHRPHVAPASGSDAHGGAAPEERFVAEARFYRRLDKTRVLCTLCPQACVLSEGERGRCRVRENRAGGLYTLVHSRVCAVHVDAIEKKPLFHYLPGAATFSIATAGCNVHCAFCQNWDISQSRPEDVPAEYMPPDRVVELAQTSGCAAVAYTYNEPTVFAEYLIDTAEAARAAGLGNLAVSNGYIQHGALVDVFARLDAVKIDLKAFTDRFYQDIAGGRLKPVLHTLTTLRSMNKWIEIVYLILPMLNDSDEELRGLAGWIRSNLGVDVPLHFTRYHPDYRLRNVPPTPVETLERAKAIADAEGLHFVYIGNVPGHAAQNTLCPGCGKLLVERTGFTVTRMSIGADGACPFCACPAPGIWHP